MALCYLNFYKSKGFISRFLLLLISRVLHLTIRLLSAPLNIYMQF